MKVFLGHLNHLQSYEIILFFQRNYTAEEQSFRIYKVFLKQMWFFMEPLYQNPRIKTAPKGKEISPKPASLRSLYPEALLGMLSVRVRPSELCGEFLLVLLLHSPALDLFPDGRPEAPHAPGGGSGPAPWLDPWRWRVPVWHSHVQKCLNERLET